MAGWFVINDGRFTVASFAAALVLLFGGGVCLAQEDSVDEGAGMEEVPVVEEVEPADEGAAEEGDTASLPVAPAPEVVEEPHTQPEPEISQETSAMLAPAAETYVPRPRKRRKLLVVGLATFGGGYVFSVLVSAMLKMKEAELGPNEKCINCDELAPRLLIPLVGPYLAIPHADGADGKTVAVAMGLVQTAGFVMTIIGIQVLVKSKREIEEYDAMYGTAFYSSRRLTASVTGNGFNLRW